MIKLNEKGFDNFDFGKFQIPLFNFSGVKCFLTNMHSSEEKGYIYSYRSVITSAAKANPKIQFVTQENQIIMANLSNNVAILLVYIVQVVGEEKLY